MSASSRSLSSTSSSTTTIVGKRRRLVVVALWALTGLVLVRISDEKFASWLPESINSGRRKTDIQFVHVNDNISVDNDDDRHIPADLRPSVKEERQKKVLSQMGGINDQSTIMITTNVTSSQQQQQQQQQPTIKGHATVNDTRPLSVVTFEPNKTRSIAFIHVGKNGGNTMRMAFPRLKCRRLPGGLYKKLRCFKRTFRPESPLAHQMNIEMHMQQVGPNVASLEKDYTTFLYALRNPVTRAISAYRYLHHNNTRSPYAQKKHPMKEKFYKECFPTLQDLLDTLVEIEVHNTTNSSKSNNDTVTEIHSNQKRPKQCQRMAVNVLKGNKPIVKHINIHLRDNYQFYYQRTIESFPDKEVLVVRTEQLWEDIKALDQQMGGPGDFPNEGSVANQNPLNNNKNGTSSNITSTLQQEDQKHHQLRSLCCILVDEMKIFQEILNRAVNFNYRNKLETMQDVWESCGIDSHQILEYQQGRQDDVTTDTDTTRASIQSIIRFSWSKWHQEMCPELAVRNS